MLGSAFSAPWKMEPPLRFVGESKPDPHTGGAGGGSRPQAEAKSPIESNCTERPPSAVMVVEQAITGADDGLAIAGGVPGQSDTGSDVVVIARNAFHNTESLLRGGI